LKKIRPIFGNVAQTVARNIKTQIEGPNTFFKLLLNVKKYNKPCFENAYLVKNAERPKEKSSQIANFRPIWSPCPWQAFIA
jgi:hypothetical protein